MGQIRNGQAERAERDRDRDLRPREREIGFKRPGDRNRESGPLERGESKQEKWEVKDQGQIGIEGTRQGRGHSGVEGSLPNRPAPGEGSDGDGDTRLERCQLPDPMSVCGTCGATPDVVFPAPFPHKPPPPPIRAPFPWPRSRGDPELEKTPRQAPRLGAAERERQESVKEARSPSAKTVSLGDL